MRKGKPKERPPQTKAEKPSCSQQQTSLIPEGAQMVPNMDYPFWLPLHSVALVSKKLSADGGQHQLVAKGEKWMVGTFYHRKKGKFQSTDVELSIAAKRFFGLRHDAQVFVRVTPAR